MTQVKKGRPRSEKSREAILNAAHELLHRKGGAGLSIEGIAKLAGVGKPTIYRWWPSLADVVLEVMLRDANSTITVLEKAPFQETLRHFLKDSVRAIHEGAGVHLCFLMAHAQKDEEFRERFRENFVSKRRGVLLSLFEQAADQSEISKTQNHNLLVDMVFGAMWYRLLVGHDALGETFVEELVTTVSSLCQSE